MHFPTFIELKRALYFSDAEHQTCYLFYYSVTNGVYAIRYGCNCRRLAGGLEMKKAKPTKTTNHTGGNSIFLNRTIERMCINNNSL